MFEPIEENEIFTNQFGEKVLCGAMGVDKIKELEGKVLELLRFICILTPMNCYTRKFDGDSWSLPQAFLLCSLILGPDEVMIADSEDLESCFNLFFLPKAWRTFFVFSKQVSKAAFGGPPGEKTYVAMRGVPMGWINSVDLIQNFIRRLVFGKCQINPALEVNPFNRRLSGDAVITCMDGFDYFKRVRNLNEAQQLALEDCAPKSKTMSRFVEECQAIGLPLNESKAVYKKVSSAILGGEMTPGQIRYARDKASGFHVKSAAVLSLAEAPQVTFQHWSGLFCFKAGFRRPIFSVCQEVFKFINSFEEGGSECRSPPLEVLDEILVAALSTPLAFTNLRAPIRPVLSITDASEQGGAAGEATEFLKHVGRNAGAEADDLLMNSSEEFTRGKTGIMKCRICGSMDGVNKTVCPFKCQTVLCSVGCFRKHRLSCEFQDIPHLSVGLMASTTLANLPWELLKHEIEPVVEKTDALLQAKCGLILSVPCFIGSQAARSVQRKVERARKMGRSWDKRIRQQNQYAEDNVRVFLQQCREGRLAAIMAPSNSLFWSLKNVKQLNNVISCYACSFFLRRQGETHTWSCMHNFSNAISLLSNRTFELQSCGRAWPQTFAQVLALLFRAVLGKWDATNFPVGQLRQESWVHEALLHSTRGMARTGVAAQIGDQVGRILATVVPGREQDHLGWLLQFVDFKGSEVRVKDGTIYDGSRQAIPYPACIWNWSCVQSYTWSQPQHINVLELLAFLNFVKMHVLDRSHHQARLLHVFDSRVCSCIVGKGRSSSVLLNRVLRRTTALLLAADIYVFPLWTISRWNFSDHGSRAVVRPDWEQW